MADRRRGASSQPDRARDRDPDEAAQSLRSRLDDLDREARFHRRLAAVRDRRSRRRRRRRWIRRAGAGLAPVAAAGVGAALAGFSGAVAGAGGACVLLAALLLARSLARARGARAWDWEAGRYRLLGDPSARVQALDSDEPPRGPLAP